ncbi:hypothetical protein DFH06DRAFT_1145327 [Mycena polygramma]|nr:hypothetical protein DFH06DRAFT_1145327 [Mycena polygramma]
MLVRYQRLIGRAIVGLPLFFGVMQSFRLTLHAEVLYNISSPQHQIDPGVSLFMTTPSRARKKKKIGQKGREDEDTYQPGLSKQERAVAHRKAQAKYRARLSGGVKRNPEIREKQRVQAAERRAIAKAKRRRWDRPKAPKAPSPSQSAHPSQRGSHLTFLESDRQQSRMPDVGTTGSPSPDEQIAVLALAELAEGGASFDRQRPTAMVLEARQSWDSVLHVPMHFPPHFSLGDGPISIAAQAGNLPSGVTALSRVQEIEVRCTGCVSQLTPVQSAQIFVAELNARELTAPTAAEVVQWGVRPDLRSWDHVSYLQGRNINGWRVAVCKAQRAERLGSAT